MSSDSSSQHPTSPNPDAQVQPALRLELRYFASLREALGYAHISVQAPCTTVAALRAWLRQQSPAARQALAPERVVRCAVNHSLCQEDQVLQDGDEVAFFPPVTGG